MASGYGAAEAGPQKVLIAGDVRGDFGTLFAKVVTADARHGPFACLFCVGDFLGTGPDPAKGLRPYVTGEKRAPVTTYLLNARRGCPVTMALLEGHPNGEIAKDVILLADSGLTVLSGLTVAFDPVPIWDAPTVAGPARKAPESGVVEGGACGDGGGGENGAMAVPVAEEELDDGAAETEALDAILARTSYTGADLLLTARWPRGVCRALDADADSKAREALAAACASSASAAGPPKPGDDTDAVAPGTRRAARLAAAARPRYHFAGGAGVAWARPPYANWQASGQLGHVTRFVSLASVGNAAGLKWLHALNLVPMSRMQTDKLLDQPAGTTANPYEGTFVSRPTPSAPSLPLPAKGVCLGAAAGAAQHHSGPAGCMPAPPPTLSEVRGPAEQPGHLPIPPPPPAGVPPSGPPAPGVLPPPPPPPPPGAKRWASNARDGCPGRKRQAVVAFTREHGDDCAVDEVAVEELLAQREAARAEKDFATADALRARLRDQLGVLVHDGDRTWRVAPAGTRSAAAAAARGWAASACWFCMASEHFEAHLVIAVGSEAYVAMAKGPLTPGNVIVLPIAHVNSASVCPQSAVSDMQAFRAALAKCFASEGLSTVAFERCMGAGRENSRVGGDHLHLQVLPVPRGMEAAAVRSRLEGEGAAAGVRFEHLQDSRWPPDGLEVGEAYLWFGLPEGHGSLLHRMRHADRRHPAAFARQALARAFECPERADWKACMPDPVAQGGGSMTIGELEAREAQDLKKRFEPFDPTM